MREDPPVKKDGRCARPGCGKDRPVLAVAIGDPFCSAACCRLWHHVDAPAPVRRVKPNG